jgi:hypothetical protein
MLEVMSQSAAYRHERNGSVSAGLFGDRVRPGGRCEPPPRDSESALPLKAILPDVSRSNFAQDLFVIFIEMEEP